MMTRWDIVEGGLYGLLTGDALGVPYEFHSADSLPPLGGIDMVPPSGFIRSYCHVPLGTWSDDGAQALCLLESLLESGGWSPADFATRLVMWYCDGHLAVDGQVFDVGIQTGVALDNLVAGCDPLRSGLDGERNNGNGSLMRMLPMVILHSGSLRSLATMAHEQSCLTHSHPRSQVCCALYAFWAHFEIHQSPDPWGEAVEALRAIYPAGSIFRRELDEVVVPYPERHTLNGSGYVVDCLHSARTACQEADYRSVVLRAVALGNDTDTTACVAGGIAGLRHGRSGIPAKWLSMLRGEEILRPLLGRLRDVLVSLDRSNRSD